MIYLYFQIAVCMFLLRLLIIFIELKTCGEWTLIVSHRWNDYVDDVESFVRLQKVEGEHLFISFLSCLCWPLLLMFLLIAACVYGALFIFTFLANKLNKITKDKENV